MKMSLGVVGHDRYGAPCIVGGLGVVRVTSFAIALDFTQIDGFARRLPQRGKITRVDGNRLLVALECGGRASCQAFAISQRDVVGRGGCGARLRLRAQRVRWCENSRGARDHSEHLHHRDGASDGAETCAASAMIHSGLQQGSFRQADAVRA